MDSTAAFGVEHVDIQFSTIEANSKLQSSIWNFPNCISNTVGLSRPVLGYLRVAAWLPRNAAREKGKRLRPVGGRFEVGEGESSLAPDAASVLHSFSL
jgi:hypothetical protein